MLHLVAASMIWAFSFGLIKTRLAGVDPALVAFLRLALSALVFAPWLRHPLPRRRAVALMGLGAVQFGAMYLLYLASYRYLPAYAVAVATIFTPLYVVAIENALQRRSDRRDLLAAILAVAGAAIVQIHQMPSGALRGFLLVQAANLCFALGQILYRHLAKPPTFDDVGGEPEPGHPRNPQPREDIAGDPAPAPRRPQSAEGPANLAWMYLGATVVTALAALIGGDRASWSLDREAWLVVVYLGLMPTAVGFYLWNQGALRTGAGALAVANNLKVPLAVGVAWLVFGESADYIRVLVGLVILVAALFVAGGKRGEDRHG